MKIFTSILSIIIQSVILIIGIIWYINSKGEEPLMAIISSASVVFSLIWKFFVKNKNGEQQQSIETKVEANNALIVTNNQSGGFNVVNQKVDLPKPSFEKISSAENEKVNMMPSMGIIKKKIPNEKYNYEFVYKSEYTFKYHCDIPHNGFGYLINRDDCLAVEMKHIGILIVKTGIYQDKKFISIDKPTNGNYTLIIYTVNECQSIENDIKLLL